MLKKTNKFSIPDIGKIKEHNLKAKWVTQNIMSKPLIFIVKRIERMSKKKKIRQIHEPKYKLTSINNVNDSISGKRKEKKRATKLMKID